ncbi:MAG: FAD-binding oxidoreductase [Planctomycetaceae bacterium]|nr:FAD-binding oxidoreductase [Planctomycetaceae bacterium]
MSETDWKPTTATELASLVLENFENERRPLIPCGGRTSLHFGYPVAGEPILVSTTALESVIDYPCRDMTITVEAGMRVEKLQEILREEGQRLPIDVPEGHRASIGGAIASNASGPSQFGYGTFRDYVIGISAIDGQGRLFSAGGRVVKNVAGYDFCKLLTGSEGMLGAITQVTLKVRPVVECRELVWVTVSDKSLIEPILDRLNLSATNPVVQDLLNSLGAAYVRNEAKLDLPAETQVLCLGFEGSQQEVEWQVRIVQEELAGIGEVSSQPLIGEAADQIWHALTDYQTASDDPVSFRSRILPSQVAEFFEKADEAEIAVLCHAGNGVVHGHLSDHVTDPHVARTILEPLRAIATRQSGSLTVTHCDPQWSSDMDLFGPQGSDWQLMANIKRALDPANIFCPGKLWRERN